LICAWDSGAAGTLTRRASVRAVSASSRSNGRLAMACAATQMMTTDSGHNSNSGTSSQSRMSPNSERCGRALGKDLSGTESGQADATRPKGRHELIFSRQ
jgi:hypothetical protein